MEQQLQALKGLSFQIKRASPPPPANVEPPTKALAALNKEMLTLKKWSDLRDDFAEKFESEFASEISEPKKFRRHCREQLGKWVLSQKCRETPDAPPTFFPTALITYDKQLVRDLSLKCKESKVTVDRIEKFVRQYELGTRCQAAFSFVTIAQQDASMLPESFSKVVGLQIKPATKSGRIEGDALLLEFTWEGGVVPDWFIPFSNSLIPAPVWSKLEHCYRKMNPNASVTEFPVRAATVVVRYEHVLCSGSLQLCADSAQKDRLSEVGYYVMDLCASPINAYMGPKLPESAGPMVVRPFRRFCSAFADTDSFFGSCGSLMHFHALKFVEQNESRGHPCIFTLDIPYDEDMAELMLGKLHRDAEVVAKLGAAGARIAWMLTLPLWWNLDFVYIPRALATPTECSPEQLVLVHKNIENHLTRCHAYQQQGYVLPFTWIEEFQRTPLVCFNALFVKGAYTYFDAGLNKPLPGITETQVIALQHPQFAEYNSGVPNIRKVLHEFYPHLCVF